MSSSRPPKYCRNRQKGRPDRAYVKIDGKRFELGVFGSPESKAKYASLIAKSKDGGQVDGAPSTSPTNPPTVSELLAQFIAYAVDYYDESNPRGEYHNFIPVLRLLRQHFGETPASDFGPKRLKELQRFMIAMGWSRKYLNRQVVRVRQIFRWGVSEQIVPANQLDALTAVDGLRAGRTDAKELPPVLPVDETVIDATIAELSQTVGDMVRIHKLIGCRPRELVTMRPALIDRSESVWVYSPESHKNKWRGKYRKIAIGPQAQKLLAKHLFGEWCFMSRTDGGKSTAYLVGSYRQAVVRACERAEVNRWTPGQLRHNAATKTRSELGLDHAQAVMGHASAQMSQHYAQLEFAKAIEVAKRIG